MARRRRKSVVKAKPLTLTILLILGLLVVLFNVLTYFGLWDLSLWIPLIGTFAIVGILIVEAGYKQYTKVSTYKRLKGSDYLNLFTFLVAGALLMTSIFGLGLLDGNSVAEWFKSMSAYTHIVAGILVLIHLFWK